MGLKIADIAKLANVSKSAVSIALNGKPGISEETRSKILRIVNESGYIPRSMVRADQIYPATKIIRFVACTNLGIVTNQFDSLPFFTELIRNIEEQCRGYGFSMVFSSIQYANFDQEVERLEKEAPSNGIILLGTNLTEDQISRISKYQPNLVVIDTLYETLNVNFVVMNNFMGAYQAGAYLAALGHRHIGYIQSTSRMFNFNERRRGFLAALRAHGITVEQSNFFDVFPAIVSEDEEFKKEIVKRKNHLPTALFCECDYIAITVVKTLLNAGYQVPEDISIIGFDNISEATVITPELSTIHVDREKMAKAAINMLKEMITDRNTVSSKCIVDTSLITRKSCELIK